MITQALKSSTIVVEDLSPRGSLTTLGKELGSEMAGGKVQPERL